MLGGGGGGGLVSLESHCDLGHVPNRSPLSVLTIVGRPAFDVTEFHGSSLKKCVHIARLDLYESYRRIIAPA